MSESVVYNCDCMDYLRTLPDNAFDLAVVDPPYGAGFTEGGGCKGWFTKYHQNGDCSQSVHVERERTRADITASETPAVNSKNTSVKERTAKKSSRGTLPLEKNTLQSFSASHAIRSYGAAITSIFHPPAAFWYGES